MSRDAGTSTHLRAAGGNLVAAVYALAGCRVAWPLEPAPYDLVVERADGVMLRVQVKTCTTRQGGSWICWITRSTYAAVPGGKTRVRYATSDVDVLAVVDGDGAVYLIPFDVVAHQSTVTLRAYRSYLAARLEIAPDTCAAV